MLTLPKATQNKSNLHSTSSLFFAPMPKSSPPSVKSSKSQFITTSYLDYRRQGKNCLHGKGGEGNSPARGTLPTKRFFKAFMNIIRSQ